MINRNVASLARDLARKVKPKAKMSGLEYVEKYGYITSHTEGRQKWRTRPYQRDWFLAITDPEVECMVCVKPSRVGWSQYVKLVVQFFCHWKLSKIMIIQPTDSEVDTYSNEDIDPMFDENEGVPALKGMLSNKKSKGALKNTYGFKQLLNGALIHLASAATPRSGRRVERSVILFEEPATYDSPEGDTIGNLFQRAGTVWDPFFTIGGTPIRPNDYMDQSFKKGDQQYRYYPCPHCGHYQQLAWERFIIDGPDEGRIRCENCETAIDYSNLRDMDENAGWACPLGLDRSRQILRDGKPIWRSQQVGPGMSYHRAATWPELVSRYKVALEQMKMGNPDPMQTFHNTDRGIVWEDSITGKLTADGLAARRKDRIAGNSYPWDGGTWTVPNGVVVLTAGVDVQGGGGAIGERLVLTIWGWGAGEEGWHIGHWSIDGDPQQQEVWIQLDQVLMTRFIREDGAELKVARGGIDHGGHAGTQVLEFCKTRSNIWAPMKGGDGGRNKVLVGKGSPVEINRKNQSIVKGSTLLYWIWYEGSVNKLQAQLRIDKPGPGYLHFGQASDDDFLAELFPWKRIPKNKERTIYKWECPVGSRDEAGDCTRMAYAALVILSRRYNRATMWDQLAAQVRRPVVKTADENPVKSKQHAKRRNFVTDI